MMTHDFWGLLHEGNLLYFHALLYLRCIIGTTRKCVTKLEEIKKHYAIDSNGRYRGHIKKLKENGVNIQAFPERG